MCLRPSYRYDARARIKTHPRVPTPPNHTSTPPSQRHGRDAAERHSTILAVRPVARASLQTTCVNVPFPKPVPAVKPTNPPLTKNIPKRQPSRLTREQLASRKDADATGATCTTPAITARERLHDVARSAFRDDYRSGGPNLVECKPKLAAPGPIFWSMLVRVGSDLAEFGPWLTEFRPKSGLCWPNSEEFGRFRAKPGQFWLASGNN